MNSCLVSVSSVGSSERTSALMQDTPIRDELQMLKAKLSRLENALTSSGSVSGMPANGAPSPAPRIGSVPPPPLQTSSSVPKVSSLLSMTSIPSIGAPNIGPTSSGSSSLPPLISNFTDSATSLGSKPHTPLPVLTRSSGVFSANNLGSPMVSFTQSDAAPDDMARFREEYNIDTNGIIDFYSGYSPMMLHYSRINNHGPLAWVSIVLKDGFSKPILQRIIAYKKSHNISMSGADTEVAFSKPNSLPDITNSDKEFRARVLESSGMADVKLFNKPQDPHTSCKEIPNGKTTYGVSGPASGCTQMPQINFGASRSSTSLSFSASKKEAEKVTMERIIDVLPTPKTMWMLVDRFFQYVYPFLPYLDQPRFVSEVERIIGRRDIPNKKITELHIEKRLDFAIVGSLLIVLRTAYMSLFSNYEGKDSPKRTEEEDYLLSHPIPADTINAAQLCLNQFKLLRRCALSIFQCAMLMRDFQRLDGSDGFSDGDTQVFTGMLIQMGISIGLNRDPTKFDDKVSDNRIGALWRKIWYKLISEDNYQASQMGSPKLIRDDLYDTQLPIFSRTTLNNYDEDLEEMTIKSIQERFELEELIDKGCRKILNIRKSSTVGEILKDLEEVETFLSNKWGSLAELLTPKSEDHVENVSKVKSIISYCEAISFLHPVYYHLLFHYQESQNAKACFNFAKKIMFLLMQVISNFVELIKHSYRYVGRGFDYVLTPTLEVSIHKALQMRMGIYIRTGVLLEKLEKLGGHEDECETLRKYMQEWIGFGDSYLQGLALVANRDFYAWRMVKAHSFIWRVLKDNTTSLFENGEHPYNFLEHITTEERNELFRMSQEELYRVSKMNRSSTSPTDKTLGLLNSPVSLDLPNRASSFSAGSNDVDKFWLETFYNRSGGDADEFDVDTLLSGMPEFEDLLGTVSQDAINSNADAQPDDGPSLQKSSLMGRAVFDMYFDHP